MLLSLVQLVRDEGSARFAQDPLLHEPLLFRIPSDLDAWGESIDVLSQVVIKERRPSFDRMRHLRSITQA